MMIEVRTDYVHDGGPTMPITALVSAPGMTDAQLIAATLRRIDELFDRFNAQERFDPRCPIMDIREGVAEMGERITERSG